ncbi:Disks large-associated protein 1, partial [Frankliniella fusca]
IMVSASHYRDLLNQESTTISALCDDWQRVLNENDSCSAIPDDVCGKIQIAIGQAQLLMRKKFEQFRGLITANETNDSVRLVTVQDLQGFWELMYIQVKDIYCKFEELKKLKLNNWEPLLSPNLKRQPLGNVNSSRTNNVPHRIPVVTKDFTAQARERLAQAKALARKRMEEQCCQ